ncbi:MAG: hypothetical protein KDN18_19270 [Verrucomicrobiae bacterium]|nr:hypothetical protein [Verrucomicrobiae bacterium]
MAINQEWKIRATQARCEVTGESFSDGQEFFTCIFEDPESDGFLRRDYSAPIWRDIRKTLDPAPYSFWKSAYKAPIREDADTSSEETSVEGMLRRFIEEDDPRTENARYILALMLERNKTLIPVDSKTTGERTILFYEHADNGDVFIVADPGLRLDEIETVQREVSELLAEEERRAKEVGGSDGGEQPQDEIGDNHEEEPEKSGEDAAETKDEAVAFAGEETAEGFGANSGVCAGEELSDEVEDNLEKADHREEPSPDNDEFETDGRVD